MEQNRHPHPRIVIAGASGYIGKPLIAKLLERFPNAQIIALARSHQTSEDPRIEWRSCDLFSIESLEQSLPEPVDLAYYLVHSMGPTAQLDQGSFADYDLILADNFARTARDLGVKQIIYLGGLASETSHLSLHLQSRIEVEKTFQQFHLPTTTFRAGLILGASGSSSQILIKLVRRLPVMICPAWTQTRTTPVDLDTVLRALTEAALDPRHIGQVYDLAGCAPLTYIEMMKETARRMGKKRYFFTVPFFTPTLSRLWVSLITNSPKNLVYPLIESLEHEMVARPDHMFHEGSEKRSYYELLEKVPLKVLGKYQIFRFQAERKTVRSVQRLPIPAGKDAEWAKNQYIRWLPKFLAPLIQVEADERQVSFSLLRKRWVFLQLEPDTKRSQSDWQILAIRRGLLVAEENKGRLEFRLVLEGRYLIAAIHDYTPALPWFVYIFTQAKLHLFVMKAFSRHLTAKSKSRAASVGA